MAKVEVIESQDLNHVRLAELRLLLEAAFPNQFSDSDWEHTMGGHHIVLTIDGAMAAHVAVVERTLHAAGRPIRTGYVESVATLPEFQNGGHGSNVMRTATGFIRGEYDFGALSTGSWDFYERLGWERWLGRRSSVIGMTGFGASGPAADLYRHFGITAQAVHDEVRRLLQI